jgi:hypothetical protein
VEGDVRSLRSLVDKWGEYTPGSTVRLTRSRCFQSTAARSICLAATAQDRTVMIFFFRHEDGSWSVVPPTAKRPTLRTS